MHTLALVSCMVVSSPASRRCRAELVQFDVVAGLPSPQRSNAVGGSRSPGALPTSSSPTSRCLRLIARPCPRSDARPLCMALQVIAKVDQFKPQELANVMCEYANSQALRAAARHLPGPPSPATAAAAAATAAPACVQSAAGRRRTRRRCGGGGAHVRLRARRALMCVRSPF